jgi:3-phenylpropionate/trans-cinnamate dioxygenase ferredoxin component
MAKVQICNESELAEGSITAFHTKYGAVAVAKSGGKIFAFEEKCSHANVSLATGHIESEVVVCKAHGARFDLNTGNALSLPATGPIETYPVSIHDGMIEIDI